MRHLLSASLLVIAASASAQSTWTGDHFTVSTDNSTSVSVAGGTVTVADMPYLVGFSSPAGNQDEGPVQFNLEFAALPGYVLLGEQVTLQLHVEVGSVDAGDAVFIPASATYTIDINGVYTVSQTFGAVSVDLTPSHFLADPNLVLWVDASTVEGQACPIGHEADSCGFGGYWRFQDAVVALNGITITPLLAAVPEPAPGPLLLAGLGLLAGTRVARRAQRA